MTIQEKLQSLGLTIPQAAAPLASYVPAVRTGTLVYTSGQVPMRDGTVVYQGQVGSDVTQNDAYQAARICCLNALAAIQAEIGDLNGVTRIVHVTGYVASADGFTDQPQVINGASDLLLELFGDAGRHSRAAVGVSRLPRNAATEVDIIAEVKSQ